MPTELPPNARGMSTERQLETLFKALADRTRLRILGLLLGGEVCVCDIHESLKIPQPRASRHLAYLRRAGLVEARRKGLWVHYRLAPAADAVRGAVVGAVGHALGHVPAVARDRQRLDKRTGCCAPLWAAAGPNFRSVGEVRPAPFACCAPDTAAELPFDVAQGTPSPRRGVKFGPTAEPSASPAGTADGHPHSPDPSSSGESSA